jgi:signal peptidase I
VAEKGYASEDGQFSLPDGESATCGRSLWHAASCVGLVLAIAIAAVIITSELNRAPAQMLRVASGSMQPTLAIGQVVHVDASAYASAAPRIGDIVAFHAPAGATAEIPVCGVPRATSEVCARSTPAESDQIFIKRVVAAPGDTIAVLDGSVVRNGALQREPFTAACDGRAGCNFAIAIEVPAGEWFVMGDDRGPSDDSRYWGPVPRAWIVGKVVN